MQDGFALVVDGESTVRHHISAVFCSDGFKILEAAGGAEAFRLVQTLHGRLDLIVSDIQMPEVTASRWHLR
jgi:CheY-like chemotaxis protein